MIDVKNIHLSPEELEKCMEFSRTSAPNQQSIEFGQRTTKPRSIREISRDNLIGKIAEVAFSKIMKENYEIDVPLDFNYYPRGKWDDQDTVINGWRIDVKGTRIGGHWMLIEWNKLDFRQKDRNLSHVYVMFSVDWDRDKDYPSGLVRFEGVASLEKLQHNCQTTLSLSKGSAIPGTQMPLQADNYGIHFRNLNNDLDSFVKYITECAPPDNLTNQYPNPYTGEIIAEACLGMESIIEKPECKNLVVEKDEKQNQKNFRDSFLKWIKKAFT